MLIFTAVHLRPEIFRIFLSHLREGHTLAVAGSKDDECYEVWKHDSHSCPSSHFIEAPNKPLSDKFNIGLQGLRDIPFDYLFITGSDDIYTPGLWRAYEHLAQHKLYDYVGLLDFYFTDFQKTKYCPGFQHNRLGEPHGAGRMISREVIEKMDFTLWDNGLNSGLDASMTKRLNTLNLKTHFFRCKDINEIAIDLKTQNIQSMDDYEGEIVSNDILKRVLKPEVVW